MKRLWCVGAIAAVFAGLPGTGSYAAGATPLFHFIAVEARAELKAIEGKRVLGKNRELLGHVGRIDEQAKTAELKTPSGAIVSLSVDLLVRDGEDLAAPSLSRGDVIAMSKEDRSTVYEAGILPKGIIP